MEELNKLEVEKEVDARGTACPGPLLEVKKNMGDVSDGGIMKVLSSESGTKKDLTRWSKKMGHEYLGDYEESGYFVIYLKKA
jgi:TusA-related sulfurtransferase